jgi:hypothetical protein
MHDGADFGREVARIVLGARNDAAGEAFRKRQV